MKHLLILAILYACGATSALNTSKKCRDLEVVIQRNWKVDEKKLVCYASRTFIDSLANYYSECVINKDTSYMFKILGKTYIPEAPLFGKLNKEYKLKVSYNYYISTMKDVSIPNISLCYGADSIGVIKHVSVIGVDVISK